MFKRRGLQLGRRQMLEFNTKKGKNRVGAGDCRLLQELRIGKEIL